MKRREFIALVGGAAAAWPVVARAQQSKMPVIGFLNRTLPDQDGGRLRAFREGLKESGYIEGQNILIEYRWAGGSREPLQPLAADLVRRQVSVIAAGGDAAGLAAKRATDTIPIVFSGGSDPVRLGLVASLNQPGGNVTGIVNLNIELGPKRLELMHELVPTAKIMFLLVNPTNPSADMITRDLQEAAKNIGLETQTLHARAESDFESIFANLVERRAGALVFGADLFLPTLSKQLATLTLRHLVPAISQTRDFPAAGGLSSYGTDLNEQYRLVGRYTARILKGEKPSDLPVQQAKNIEFVINLKTAKALNLTVPLPLLGRADEVIE